MEPDCEVKDKVVFETTQEALEPTLEDVFEKAKVKFPGDVVAATKTLWRYSNGQEEAAYNLSIQHNNEIIFSIYRELSLTDLLHALD